MSQISHESPRGTKDELNLIYVTFVIAHIELKFKLVITCTKLVVETQSWCHNNKTTINC